ncbi:MAG: cyclodeaminase/cyclohydrolase family protein [Pirellulales bacterium]|nr:cyclodeaminase/cyclohydrolase family protein [Pirellulales bacterium]
MTGQPIEHNTIAGFLAALGSAEPTPGGGSAAALVAAISAGLVEMTARVSANRKSHAVQRPELLDIADRAAALRAELLRLANEDVAAYGEVAGAYRLPKSTAAEQAARAAAIERALMIATDVPFEIAGRSLDVAQLAATAIAAGATTIIGDSGVAAHGAVAALRGVLLNADQNLRSIQDEAFAERGVAHSRQLKQSAEAALALAQRRLKERGVDD